MSTIWSFCRRLCIAPCTQKNYYLNVNIYLKVAIFLEKYILKKFGSINEVPISSQLCLLAHTTPLVFLLVQLVFDQTASPFSNFACTHKPSSLLLLNDENIHFYSQQSMQPKNRFTYETTQLFWLPIGPFSVSTECMKVHNSNSIDEFPCLYISYDVHLILNTWKLIDYFSIWFVWDEIIIYDMIH